MRNTAGKATDNGLGFHPAEPFPFPAADEKLVCTTVGVGKKWEGQGLPAAVASTDIQARQISDDNGYNTEVLNKFHLLCRGKTSLHHEAVEYSVLLPPSSSPSN